MASKEKTSSPKTPSPLAAVVPTSTLMKRCQHSFYIMPKIKWNLFLCTGKRCFFKEDKYCCLGEPWKGSELFICFFLVFLFVCLENVGLLRILLFQIEAIHFLIIRHKSQDMVIKHKKKTSKEMRSTTETPSKREKIQSKETRLGKWAKRPGKRRLLPQEWSLWFKQMERVLRR